MNADRPGADAEVVQRIRTAVLERLGQRHDRDRLSHTDQRLLIREWLEAELDLESRHRIQGGSPQLDRDQELAVIRAVENTVWGLGRLQALLDVPNVEDIHITGSEAPLLRMIDGSVRRADAPVADTDADLVTQLQYIAAHHGSTERPFSPSQPFLNMELPDGSRLAAVRDVTDRPVVTIRRHRLVEISLADLVRMGTVGSDMARFLTAMVVARRSIIVTGMPAVGKTTLLRALAKAIPATERIATIETEFELNLHRLPARSPLLIAFEARAGSTEVDPVTGRRAGEMTLADLLHQTLRMSVTRVIVGEVRGAEALPMLEAMSAGLPGSMCTVHAGSAGDAFERIVTAALKGAGAGWSDTFLTRLAAQGIDYVVHLRQLDHPALGGRRRFVSEIAEVTDVAESGGVAMNRIFAPNDSGDPRAVFQMAPQIRAPFEEAGIDLGFLHRRDAAVGQGVR
ncbi:CpaF family protein [Pseudonocardia sp. GCM10023141]|uniref:CpaF family protein n=1 Tax=Pseudonocardia sp. GCM10023141 TaxID=3252653 RepID=UPI00361FF465